MGKRFKHKTDVELIESFNTLVGAQKCKEIKPGYLQELRDEFDWRNWDYSVIINSFGNFNLAAGNHVYLTENKLFLVSEYLLEIVDEQIVIGKITHRTRLWINIRILFPYFGWKNCIGIPRQALGTKKHFWTKAGNKYVKEYGLKLLIESYEKVKIIDENIDAFVGIYNEFQKELIAIDKLNESKKKEKKKIALHRTFHDNLHISYGLHLSIYDNEQFEEIILAYKSHKRKIYLN